MTRQQIKQTAIQIYLETVKIGGEDEAYVAVQDYLVEKLYGDTPSGCLPRNHDVVEKICSLEEICCEAEEKR